MAVSDFSGPMDWQWSLTEAGREIGRHSVRITATEWQFSAFADLFGHIGWRTTAASRRRLEPAVARQLGVWAAERLLGDLASHLEAPATVEVILPGRASVLGLLPLEGRWWSAIEPWRCAASPLLSMSARTADTRRRRRRRASAPQGTGCGSSPSLACQAELRRWPCGASGWR